MPVLDGNGGLVGPMRRDWSAPWREGVFADGQAVRMREERASADTALIGRDLRPCPAAPRGLCLALEALDRHYYEKPVNAADVQQRDEARRPE
jgi:hypothetical protein